MNDQMEPQEDSSARSARHWAPPISTLKASSIPGGAINLNVEGRQVAGALQGFGQLWQKTYRVRLKGVQKTPEEVMQIWKENFIRYQPPDNHFRPTVAGFKPGEVIFIDTTLPTLPGTPGVIPIATGVLVLYEDETSISVMTPEGHPEAGWNTFSTYEENGETVAQILGFARSADPIYEFGLRFMGGAKMQEGTWQHVLSALAADLGARAEVTMEKVCVDPKLQWSQAGNVWKNAGVRTVFYKLSTPIRWASKQVTSRLKH